MTRNHIRLGLIGAGPWGRRYIPTIDRLPGVQLSRLASRNPKSRRLVDDACKIHSHWRDVVDAADVDGVIIATPPNLHGPMALAAVEAGLAVLVEKPLTLDLAEAENLLREARARQALVMVDHILLYSPAYRRLKELAAAAGPSSKKAAEAIRAINSQNGNWGPFRANTPVLWDWGSHEVALCLDLMGRMPATVEARRTESQKVDGDRGETIDLELGFAHGMEAKITIGNLFDQRRRRLEVSLDTETLIYDDTADHPLSRRRPSSGKAKTLPVDDTPPLDCIVAEFTAAIGAGSRDISGLELGVDVVSVLARANRSLEAAAQGP